MSALHRGGHRRNFVQEQGLDQRIAFVALALDDHVSVHLASHERCRAHR
jgi:hypothetical protein